MKPIPALDGVRGLAVLAVVLFHNHSRLARYFDAPALEPAFVWGWIGVDVFFVLSGFLCTSILLAGPVTARRARHFVARRILRTWPLYFVGLGVLVALGAVHVVPFLWYGQNLGAGAPPGNYDHTWSLAVEEQFYLVLPLAWFALGRRRLPWALGIAIIIALAARAAYLADGEAYAAYVRPWARIDGMALGGLVAYAGARVPVAAAGVAALALPACTAFLAIGVGGRYGGDALAAAGPALGAVLPLFVAIGAAGLIRLAVVGGRLARVLAWRPFRDLGRVSYGVYLVHYPLASYRREFLMLLLGAGVPYERAEAVAWLVEFAILVLIVKVSWRWLETPALALKRYFADGGARDLEARAATVSECGATRKSDSPAQNSRV